MANTLRTMVPVEFARRLDGVLKGDADQRFALLLGAGCSRSSGIPTAGELVQNHWLPRLRDMRARERRDLENWAKEAFTDYDPGNPAGLYGPLIRELFLTPQEQQREIEHQCEGRFPAYGYGVLAMLMDRGEGRFSVAMTTNFDDLVADALYLYTPKRPLVIHHDALARYIRPTRTRPLVVKLHGDHSLSPKNTPEETATLDKGLKEKFHDLLMDRGLIFMGYGGNDVSIIKALQELPQDALPQGVFWVSPQPPADAILPWLEERGAFWVAEKFDEMMLLIHNACDDLPTPDEKRFQQVFTNFNETYEKLSGKVQDQPKALDLLDAVIGVNKKFTNWFSVEVEANQYKKSAPDRADQIYQDGIKQFQTSLELLGNYAFFLYDIRKDYDQAEEHYRRALAVAPGHAKTLGNYAVLLDDIRKDYDQAEEYYRRALAADPGHANTLGNYAFFLHSIRKDYDQAEEHYRRALASDPGHANNLGNYAFFLYDIRKDYDQAEEHYRRALAADPRHVKTLGNYAVLLDDIRKDYDQAEELYRRALAADPGHANILGNYANFLQDIRKDYDQAEELYRRALAADPGHANHL